MTMHITLSYVGQLGEKLVELLLSLVQLTAAHIINTEQGHYAVNDEKPILVVHKVLGHFVEKLHLMLRINSTSVGDVLER